MSTADRDVVPPIERTLRIVIVCLCMGPAAVLAIGFLGLFDSKPKPDALPVITVASIVVAASAVPLSFLLPAVFTQGTIRQIAREPKPPEGDAARLAKLFVPLTIMGAALTEGVAFLAAIAYMIEGKPYALALAVLLILATAARFPWPGAVQSWVERQKERLETLRSGGGGV
jgi:hypothetical protein